MTPTARPAKNHSSSDPPAEESSLLQMARSLEVVAFDCDGVIFDSKSANVHFYNHILEKFGQPPVRADQQEFIHMHSARESLEYLFNEKRAAEQAWDYCCRIDFRQFNQYLHIEPGLTELLFALKQKFKLHVALATNRTVSTRDVLNHFQLDTYFDLVVTAADVSMPKPHPEIMEKIFAAFQVAPKQILYVGDSAIDQQLAQATGVYFAAYKNASLQAHLYLNHFEQLLHLFERVADPNRDLS